MRIRFHCPQIDCRRVSECTLDAAPATCPSCGRAISLDAAAVKPDGRLTRCPCCGGEEFFLRKDFPQRIGLALVVAVAACSVYLFGRGSIEWAMGVLAGLVVVDIVIYRLVRTLTVCYRCRAEFRDAPLDPTHAGFDLATAEKYRSGGA